MSTGRRAFRRYLLTSTVAAGSLLALAGRAQAADATPAVTTADELVVTAQKREENIQNVPMSIQALTSKKLESLHVQSFDDYVKFLPSVEYQSVGPGFANVYMRGVASGGDGNHSGSLPSVGIYLDEQPITTIGGALDIHVYDIARVEALAGPQGTLYGASSQSGTIRIITNKPDPSGFKASFDVEGNHVDHGGNGGVIEGMVNIPIAHNMAVRLVAWDEHDAGYIDNVPGTRTYPTSGFTLNNAAIARNDYNTTDIYGGRLALRIDLNENWTVTPTIMAQETKSNGIFAYDPSVGDLKVKHFYPEFGRDRWYQASLAVEGKVSNFDIVYSGSLMNRRLHTASDYTDYSFFYDSYYGHYFTDNNDNLINPSQHINGTDLFTKQSHELRISSPHDQRLRVVAGLFYQRQSHHIRQQYVVDGFATALTVTGWPNTLWLTDQLRIDRDYAAFGEAEFDVTNKLTATGGVRVFKAHNTLVGFYGFGIGFNNLSGFGSGEDRCFAPRKVGYGPCTDIDKGTTETGATWKVNLTYHIDDDKMVYGTVSTGFRPGGVNRNGSLPPYAADFLTNYEVGWKMTLLDKAVRFNGALYIENWKDFQFSFLGPNSLTIIRNAGQARIYGVDTDISWRVDDRLTLGAAASYTHAALTSNYCSKPDANGNLVTNCANPAAPAGTTLPVTPRFKANATARYEWPIGALTAHVQGAFVYQSGSWSDLRLAERALLGYQRAFGGADFSAGIAKDNWTVEVSLLNAFDTRGDLYRYAECTPSVCGAEPYILPNRPRTIAIKFGDKF